LQAKPEVVGLPKGSGHPVGRIVTPQARKKGDEKAWGEWISSTTEGKASTEGKSGYISPSHVLGRKGEWKPWLKKGGEKSKSRKKENSRERASITTRRLLENQISNWGDRQRPASSTLNYKRRPGSRQAAKTNFYDWRARSRAFLSGQRPKAHEEKTVQRRKLGHRRTSPHTRCRRTGGQNSSQDVTTGGESGFKPERTPSRILPQDRGIVNVDCSSGRGKFSGV